MNLTLIVSVLELVACSVREYEQQIADDITLIYSYDLSSAQQQAIRLEWNPDRKWSFIVTRDQNGLLGSDVLYKLRLR